MPYEDALHSFRCQQYWVPLVLMSLKFEFAEVCLRLLRGNNFNGLHFNILATQSHQMTSEDQGPVLCTSLTQLAGFDCCRFHLILDHLVLWSSSWTCCHSNRSVSLNLLGSSLFHVNRIRLHLFKQNWYLISAPATTTLLQEYPTGPGTIILNNNNLKINLKII